MTLSLEEYWVLPISFIPLFSSPEPNTVWELIVQACDHLSCHLCHPSAFSNNFSETDYETEHEYFVEKCPFFRQRDICRNNLVNTVQTQVGDNTQVGV